MIADPGHIRSQHEAAYDALADLFLGELAPVSARDAAVGVKPAHPVPPPCAAVVATSQRLTPRRSTWLRPTVATTIPAPIPFRPACTSMPWCSATCP